MITDEEHELAVEAVLTACEAHGPTTRGLRALVSDILGTVESLADGNGPSVAESVAYLRHVAEHGVAP